MYFSKKNMEKLSDNLNECFERVNKICGVNLWDSHVDEHGELYFRLLGQDVNIDRNCERVGSGMLNPKHWEWFKRKETE